MYQAKLKLVLKGFFVGSADVVPGVSGGTIAFILGIYPKLIEAIKSFDSKWLRMIFSLDLIGSKQKPQFNFLLPLGIGMFIALLFFTRVIPLPILIRTHPEIIYGLFFGLIFGSVIMFLRNYYTILKSRNLFFLIFGIVFGGFFITLSPSSTPNNSWFILICGIASISAMLLPGVSGAFVLLMLKKYSYILNAIAYFKISIILPFFIGIIMGLVIFSRLISYLLENFYEKVILFITGLLIASLYVVWPFQNRIYTIINSKEKLVASTPYIPDISNEQLAYTLLMIILGLSIIILFERLSAE